MSAGPDLTALILAGGRARRLGGRNKALLVADGQTLVQRLELALAPLVRRTWISVAEPASWTGLPALVDPEPGLGPLSGIGAGLAAAPSWLLAVAVDMPHLGAAALELLVAELAARHDQVDAIAFRIGGRPEPLVALWGPACAQVVTRRLRARQLKVAAALQDPELRLGWIEEDRVRAVDPSLRSFANVNDERDAAGL